MFSPHSSAMGPSATPQATPQAWVEQCSSSWSTAQSRDYAGLSELLSFGSWPSWWALRLTRPRIYSTADGAKPLRHREPRHSPLCFAPAPLNLNKAPSPPRCGFTKVLFWQFHKRALFPHWQQFLFTPLTNNWIVQFPDQNVWILLF